MEIIVSVTALFVMAMVIVIQHKVYKSKEVKIKEDFTEKMEKDWEVIKENEKKKSEILSGDTVADFNSTVEQLQNLSRKNKT